MKFCIKCDNMYYIAISEQNPNTLNHYCRNCGYIDNSNIDEQSCILKTDIKKGEQKYNHIINKYTKQDPTLPRVYNINCPNINCKTNTEPDTQAEVIYMRYDDDNMKYLYLCSTCDTTWKTNDSVN
jgi:DNA-directed RNA polymerase subunit M/transcription elongation factor TFIIS